MLCGHMTCQNLIVIAHLQREQGISYVLQFIRLANLNDKVKAYSTLYILIVVV